MLVNNFYIFKELLDLSDKLQTESFFITSFVFA